MLYGVTREEPRVEVYHRGGALGVEVVLTCQLPVARAGPGAEGAALPPHSLPLSAASANPSERALLALLLVLAQVYPVPLAPAPVADLPAAALGAWPGALTTVQIPGGVLVVDLRAPPTCILSWKPLPPGAGGSGLLSTSDVAAVLAVFSASARCQATGAPLPAGGAAQAAAAAASGIAAAVAAAQGALPSEVAARGGGGGALGAALLPPHWQQPQPKALPPPPAQSEREEEDEDLSVSEAAAASAGAAYGGGGPDSKGKAQINPKTHPRAFLRSLGVKLYDRRSHVVEGISWDSLAGYEDTRREVEDAVLFPMQNAGAYKEVCALTRVRPQPNTHGAYIFVGPPGTGKSTTARIIAAASDRPMVVLRCVAHFGVGLLEASPPYVFRPAHPHSQAPLLLPLALPASKTLAPPTMRSLRTTWRACWMPWAASGGACCLLTRQRACFPRATTLQRAAAEAAAWAG